MRDGALLPSLQVRRNLAYGIASGMLLRLFNCLTDVSLVLTWFAVRLHASPLVIGYLMFIATGGWSLPQLLSSRLMQRMPRKMPLYVASVLVRIVLWAAIAARVFLLKGGRSTSTLLMYFVILYSLFCLVGGLGGLPFLEIVRKAVPANQRGSFFGWRDFFGGLLALGGSVLVRYLLDERGSLAFPLNFAWLYAVAGVALAAGLLSFTLVHEPCDTMAEHAREAPPHLKDMLELLRRDRNCVLYLVTRILPLVASAAAPFYTVFASQKLGAPTAMAGTYLGAFTVALISSTLLWGGLGDRHGSRLVLLAASVLCVPLPFLPLLLGTHITYAAFTPAFFLLGVVQSGIEISSVTLILDIAPAGERVVYIGLVNTVLGIASVSQMASGWIVQRWGLNALFAVSGVSVLAALTCVQALREPRALGRAT